MKVQSFDKNTKQTKSLDKDIISLAMNVCDTEVENSYSIQYLRKYWWPEWLGTFASKKLQKELDSDLDLEILTHLHDIYE